MVAEVTSKRVGEEQYVIGHYLLNTHLLAHHIVNNVYLATLKIMRPLTCNKKTSS
jgi:hypothetical protein